MNFDVFVSHASKDKPAADAVCASLESAGIRCWIAPRDILPGVDWGAAIVEALDRCRLLVLVFSSNANESQQIRNEVVHAVNRGVAIVPVRFEDVAPTKSLAYFMGGVHWLDALTPPLEEHLRALVDTVNVLLRIDPGSGETAGQSRSEGSAGKARGRGAPIVPAAMKRQSWLSLPVLGVAAALVVAVAALVVATVWRPGAPTTRAVQMFSLPTDQELQSARDIAAKHALLMPTFTVQPPGGEVSPDALRFVGIWASNVGYEGVGRQAMLIVTTASADSKVQGFYLQGPPGPGSFNGVSQQATTMPLVGTVAGNTLTFVHVNSGATFTAKFDLNSSDVTVTVKLRDGRTADITLHPIWRLAKNA